MSRPGLFPAEVNASRELRIDLSVELRSWLYREPLVLPLGLTDKTLAGRRQLAFCGLAMVVLLTIPRVQSQMVWPGGVLIAACLLVAVRFLRESKLPLYLQKGISIVDICEIVPSEGIGPLRLGPLNYTAIRLMRKNVVTVQQGPIVTCLLRHADGWTAVVARTGEPAPDDRVPDPLEFHSIGRVMTTSPAHLTPDGVRVAVPWLMPPQRWGRPTWSASRSRRRVASCGGRAGWMRVCRRTASRSSACTGQNTWYA